MSWNKNERIPKEEIQNKVTDVTVQFAEKFGKYLAVDDFDAEPLTTSQLRKFKPKLAYAVGRAKQNGRKNKAQKIEDFFNVITDAIDKALQSPDRAKAFKNFITAFEAIVAYHKAAEKK